MLWTGAVSAAPGRDLAHLTPGKVCKAPAKLFTFPDKADRLLYNHLRFHHFLPLATRNRHQKGELEKVARFRSINNIYSLKAPLFKQALHLGIGWQ